MENPMDSFDLLTNMVVSLKVVWIITFKEMALAEKYDGQGTPTLDGTNMIFKMEMVMTANQMERCTRKDGMLMVIKFRNLKVI